MRSQRTAVLALGMLFSASPATVTLLGLTALAAQAGPGKYPLVQVNQTAVPAMYQDAKGANWSVLDGWIELYSNGSWMMKLNYRDPRGHKRSTMDFGNYMRTPDGYALTSSIFGSYKGVVHAQSLDVAYDVDNDKVAERLSFGRPGGAAPQAAGDGAPPAAAAAAASPAPPATPAGPAPSAAQPHAPAPAVTPPAVPAAISSPADARVQTLGAVSFAVPPGWRYEPPSGDGPATVGLGSGDEVAMLAFPPASSSGDAESDFTAAWGRVVGGTPPEPVYSYGSPVGYSGKWGGSAESRFVALFVLEAGSAAIPVVVVTPNRATFDDQGVAISEFLEGLRHAPLRAEPVKTAITLADLAGEWTTGGESSVNYVTVSGTYAGSSTVAHGATYLIAADGSFTYRYAGVTNRQTVRGEGGGQVELGDGTLTFREPAQNRVERYSIIAYQTALSGATVLTLLDAQYPTTGANVGFYAEKWIRAGGATH